MSKNSQANKIAIEDIYKRLVVLEIESAVTIRVYQYLNRLGAYLAAPCATTDPVYGETLKALLEIFSLDFNKYSVFGSLPTTFFGYAPLPGYFALIKSFVKGIDQFSATNVIVEPLGEDCEGRLQVKATFNFTEVAVIIQSASIPSCSTIDFDSSLSSFVFRLEENEKCEKVWKALDYNSVDQITIAPLPYEFINTTVPGYICNTNINPPPFCPTCNLPDGPLCPNAPAPRILA